MIPIHVPLLNMRDIISLPEEDYTSKLADHFLINFDKDNVAFTYDGRNAICLALKTIGLRARDEVLIPGYVCSAVKEAIKTVCKPVYVDIDQRTFNIDSSKIEQNITENTRAILIAHLYGNPCDMGEIVDISTDRNLILIEDVAQALNGKYRNKKLGSFGDLAVFSFRFSKDITSLKGGALLANKEINIRLKPNSFFNVFSQLSIILASMKSIKKIPKNIYSPLKTHVLFPFFKKRSTEIEISANTISNYQCYLLSNQLEYIDSIIEKRRINARYYSEHLHDMVRVPKETRHGKHTYYRYTIQSDKRNALCNYLLNHGIEADKMYDYYLSPLTNSIIASKNNLNLPVHNEVTREDLEKIVEAIHEFKQLE